MTQDRRTHRWWFATVVALFGTTIGALTARPTPVLVGVVGLVFASYARIGWMPTPSFDLDRSLSTNDPTPGETVIVTVTVTNTDGLVWDLRIVDGVPETLEVVDGSPRHATALLPGESVTFEYSIQAERGEHGFDPATMLLYDPSGSIEHEFSLQSEVILTCLPTLTEVPLRSQTTQYTGRTVTDTPGSGIELHSTREYHPGDALSRIDWNRRAETGELTTIEFREERAAAVLLVLDARPEAYWAREVGERNTVSYAIGAAGRVFAELLAGGDRVGIAALSDSDETCWLSPGAGQEHAHRARWLLATHPALSVIPPDPGPPELTIDPAHGTVDIEPFLSRVSTDTQFMFFTPLCDDGIADAIRRISAFGRATTVIAPDVTRSDSVGRRLARLQRENRIHDLRERAIRVVDWDVDSPLESILAHPGVRT